MNILKNLMTALIMFSSILLPAMDQNQKKAEDKKSALKFADRALILAARAGSATAAGFALKQGASIDARDGDGQTALHRAVIESYAGNTKHIKAFCEHPKLVQLLMRAGADCTIEDARGVSVLSALADQTGLFPITERILSQHILRMMHHCKKMTQDPQEALGKITYTAAYATLHDKQRRDSKEKLDEHYALLNDSLRAGSDITQEICGTKGTIIGIAYCFDDQRMQDLIAAFQKEHSKRVAQGLQPFLGVSALYPIIFECLYPQPQPGVMTGYCKDLLTMQLRSSEMADYVLEKLKRFREVEGDLWDVRDNQGYTVLQLAIMQGNLPIVHWMRSYDPLRSVQSIRQSYQCAHQHGHNEIAQLYLNDIVHKLHNAIMKNDDISVLKLINLNMPIYTIPVIRYAMQMSHQYDKKLEIIKILFAAGADVNDIATLPYETHLECAVKHNVPYVVKLLLYLGADYTRPNSKTNKIAWEQTDNAEIKALLKNPQETLNNLTETEKKVFADIKAERERRLAANKIHNATAARESVK